MITQQIIGQHTIPACISANITLADKTWFLVGGYAEWFATPTTAQEFIAALDFARANQLQITVIGEGANVLVSDAGCRGLVIRPSMQNVQAVEHETTVDVIVGAGMRMHDLIEWCLARGYTGLEEFSGIPGTVGGSVFINLHYFEFLIDQFLISGTVLNAETGAIVAVDRSWFAFGYNYSRLHDSPYYLLDATFRLTKSTEVATAYAQGRRAEIIRHRIRRYPHHGTCGSFFRNFHEHEVTLSSNGKKMIWVAYYLDRLGVKGELREGGAIVSHQHANMIVNTGTATAHDIVTLARRMQELVKQNFGIVPQPECRLLGFDTHPLL